VRDSDDNLDQYTPKSGAKFFATDTGNVYVGDGNGWNPVPVGGGSSGGSSFQFPDVFVWKDGDTTRAEGRNGEVASGSNPSPVIETAIQAGDHVQIVGDYTLSEKIFLNNYTERTIDAAEATFTADGETKLWEFYDSNWCRFRCGLLDCGSDGLVGLDVHATRGLQADVRFNYVDSGTFTEDDGVATGTYDKCAIRLKSLGGEKGCYYNRIKATRTFGDQPTGKGFVLTNTEGEISEKPNGNSLYPIHWNQFSKGIEIKQGFRNTIFQPEIGTADVALHIHEGPHTLYGDGWLEGCDTGIKIEDESPYDPDQSWRTINPTLRLVGGLSFGGTETEFGGNSADHITWLDNFDSNIYFHDGYLRQSHLDVHAGFDDFRWHANHDFQGNRIKNHAEGSGSTDPTSDSPDGWLEIENDSDDTRYVPYYE